MEENTERINEAYIIRTIILGSDWQEVLSNLVIEEGMDPMNVDLVRLSEVFMDYLQKLKTIDFRVPARFILVAAILLRMKCEILFEEEKNIMEERKEQAKIDIDAPLLPIPIERRPTRKVALNELVNALNKAFEFKEKKEGKKLRMRLAIENLIEPEEDIEVRIRNIFDKIPHHEIKLSNLIPWNRKEIVYTFMPILYLLQRGKVECHQDEFFKDIYIKVIE